MGAKADIFGEIVVFRRGADQAGGAFGNGSETRIGLGDIRDGSLI